MTAQPLAGRVALVTGASRGFGAAAARFFARSGAHVIALARTTGALEDLDSAIRAEGGQATLIPCDLTNLDLLESLGPQLAVRFSKLDILLSNAGQLGTLTPVAHAGMAEWEKITRVNFLANVQLIRTLDPLLRASPAGRALFVTSRAAIAPRAYWGMYAATKAALEATVLTYAEETRGSALRVALIDPGRMRTAMRAKAYPGEDPETLPTPEDIAPRLLPYCLPSFTDTGARITLQTDSWNAAAAAAR